MIVLKIGHRTAKFTASVLIAMLGVIPMTVSCWRPHGNKFPPAGGTRMDHKKDGVCCEQLQMGHVLSIGSVQGR